MNKKIPLGEILKPHGIKGELKILFYNEESKSLQKNQKVFLESPQKNIIEYKVERIFYSFRKNRIKFFDINTIDEADDLRGYIVNVDRSDLPKRDLKSRLVVPERGQGRAFLAYENYNNILKWNRSNFFAIAVGSLADQIRAYE